jgi:hypothetical protein
VHSFGLGFYDFRAASYLFYLPDRTTADRVFSISLYTLVVVNVILYRNLVCMFGVNIIIAFYTFMVHISE